MKKLFLVTCLSTVAAFFSYGQAEKENLTKIAVALPNIDNLDISQQIAAKLIQIELLKLEKYQVHDEFDIQEAMNKEERFKEDCFGRNCLMDLGNAAGVDYIVSSSFLGYGGKIVITLKIIEVKTGEIYKNDVREFVDESKQIQRMLEVILREMHDHEVSRAVLERIMFEQKPILSSGVSKLDNSGPRMGYSLLTGNLREFAERPENQGGMDIFPGVSMIGYQFEQQYIGTENFSALAEGLIIASGLEQGRFIPSIILMNGMRFGEKGFEIAVGPGFSLSRYSDGFFDTDGLYGDPGEYWTMRDFNRLYGPYNEYDNPVKEPAYAITRNLDTRGRHWELTPSWVMAFGRTFRAGGINVPVNVFYSSRKNGGMVGLSVGFNVSKN